MADVKGKNLAAPLLPPVAVEKKDPLLPAVQLASLWALLSAAILGVSFVFAYALDQRDIHLPSSMLPRAGSVTDAAYAELSAIVDGLAWSSVAQAAAAALALLLPGLRRCRRALACVALAAAATSHLMMAMTVVIFLIADPGWIFSSLGMCSIVDIYVFATGDVYCLMALLGRGDYANVPC